MRLLMTEPFAALVSIEERRYANLMGLVLLRQGVSHVIEGRPAMDATRIISGIADIGEYLTHQRWWHYL